MLKPIGQPGLRPELPYSDAYVLGGLALGRIMRSGKIVDSGLGKPSSVLIKYRFPKLGTTVGPEQRSMSNPRLPPVT